MKIAMLVGIFLAFQSVASASLITYEGIFELDNTTSIVGTAKHDRFYFRLTLDGSSVDQDHDSWENDGGGVNMTGTYRGAVTGFEMVRDPANTGTWDPSTLTYDFAGSTLLTTDVNSNPVPDPDHPEYSLWNEHLFVSLGVETADSPLHLINFNLYNSLFHDPNGIRQLWLDTSTPTNGFTLDDLFLHGMDTLSEFKSIKAPESKALVDSVWLDGGAGGTFGSGTVQSLAAVPIPAAVWLFGSGLIGLIGIARRKKA